MALDLNDLLTKMLQAAENALKDKWPLAASTAKDRFQGLSQVLISIEKDKLSGDLSEDEAKDLYEMHKTAVKTALETIAGIGDLLAQTAINAAMAAVKDVVNTAIGIVLIA